MLPRVQTTVFRHRRPRPGPEHELLASALRVGLPTGLSGTPLVLREPELPVGSPDVVAVFPRVTQHLERPALVPAQARILHQVWLSRRVQVDELSRLVHVPQRKLRSILGMLCEFGLVYLRGQFCVTRPLNYIFPLRHIVAVEAKMTDWRAGMDQAESNLWFASASYLLLPIRRDYSKPMAAAASRGIGLLTFDGRRVRRLVRPRTVPIPRSYGSWMLSEWFLQNGSESDD
jgi:hypothetical protein